ncbi:Fructosamine-3-kinase [Stackebrandtia soli]
MLVEHQRIRFTPIDGGVTSVAQRLTFDDGTDVFAKLHEREPADLLPAQRRGLEWLTEAGAPVPRVWCGTETLLVTRWLSSGEPTAAGASALGAALARTHRAGASAWGAEWAGYVGSVAVDNSPSTRPWADWFRNRLTTLLTRCVITGNLDDADAAIVNAALSRIPDADDEPVSRLHGDLRTANLHWDAAGDGWFIDPSAHGGHRETDLSTLALDEPPHLESIIAGYESVWPLEPGWRERQGLHQLYPLLVDVAAFGSSARDRLMTIARRYR